MVLLDIHHRALFGARVARGRFSAKAATRKLASALKTIHRAIVAAKLRRLRHELTMHRGPGKEFDVSKCPQRPLLLDDRWDF